MTPHRHLPRRAPAIAALAALATCAAATANVIWDEDVDGDLSDDRFNPTHLVLGMGVNSLIASSRQGDREFVRLDIPDGMTLDAIILESYISQSQMSFIAVQAGETFTEDPDNPNVANILGWAHFGPGANNLGEDILIDISEGQGAIGFDPPLLAGPYTYWIQETSPLDATYRMDFIVSPSPGAATLLALAGLTATRRRR